jgi:hypothetical protein
MNKTGTFIIIILLILFLLIMEMSNFNKIFSFNKRESFITNVKSSNPIITPDLTLTFTLNINSVKNEEALILKKDNMLITILPNSSKLRLYIDNTIIDMNTELPLNINNNIKFIFNRGINEENGWVHSQFISQIPDVLPSGTWQSSAQNYSINNGILYSDLLNMQGAYMPSNVIITPNANTFNNNNGSFYPSNPVPNGYNQPCCYIVNLNKKQFYQTSSNISSKTSTLNTTKLSGLTFMGQLSNNFNYSKPSVTMYVNGTQVLIEHLIMFPEFTQSSILSTENSNNTYYSLTNQLLQ